MKQKVFETIFNLIENQRLPKEDVYYLLELLFGTEKSPIYIPYINAEYPPEITWTSTGDGISVRRDETGTGDDTITNPWWNEKDSSTGLPNQAVYTSVSQEPSKVSFASTISTNSEQPDIYSC